MFPTVRGQTTGKNDPGKWGIHITSLEDALVKHVTGLMPEVRSAPSGSSPSLWGRQLSSTPLEILLFLNGWYYATYFLLEIFIFIYKGLLLPYPSANLALDLVMLFLYLGIEVTRIFFGWTRTKAPSRLFRARQGYALPQCRGPRPRIPSLHSWSDGSVPAPWSRARPSHSLIPH
ncbi:transmembrane protein 216 isoform X2 [Chelonia mydas]|uniref:transmembrane protein 216 isoform X2 n=1 Tax=Chelonia mydas TaxID=8469 RepID=UPI001CA97A64|nr:transmembrane protein 216 isoform X2 [Chelonia mydas]